MKREIQWIDDKGEPTPDDNEAIMRRNKGDFMNCPINEQTADGTIVGRCWYYLPDGKTCPRHGDVTEAIRKYLKTRRLTLESDHESQNTKN